MKENGDDSRKNHNSDHSEVQNNVCKLLNWYDIVADREHPTNDGRQIDVAGRFRSEEGPSIGIEVKISGDVSNDMTKLANYSPLKYRVILTPLRQLYERGEMKLGNVLFRTFPLPDKRETTFEKYVRESYHIDPEKPFYPWEFPIRLEDTNEALQDFENMLAENKIDLMSAERIIYSIAVVGQSYVADIPEGSREYIFLRSLGILDGLEVFSLDEEWPGELRLKGDSIEMPDATMTRSGMREAFNSFQKWKQVIGGVVDKWISERYALLASIAEKHSRLFNEIALIGSGGKFSMTGSNSRADDTFALSEFNNRRTLKSEVIRLEALASNSFVGNRLWSYGLEMVEAELGIHSGRDRIMVPYKRLSKALGIEGELRKHEGKVDEYLAWWVILHIGSRGRYSPVSLEAYCSILGLVKEEIAEKVEEVSTKGYCSKYIPESRDYFAVYERDNFAEYCNERISDALNEMI